MLTKNCHSWLSHAALLWYDYTDLVEGLQASESHAQSRDLTRPTLTGQVRNQSWYHGILSNYCRELMNKLAATCSSWVACCDKHQPKATQERKGFISSYTSRVHQKEKSGREPTQELKQKPCRKAAYWIVLSGLLWSDNPRTAFPRVPLPIVSWALPNPSTTTAVLRRAGHRPI